MADIAALAAQHDMSQKMICEPIIATSPALDSVIMHVLTILLPT